MTRQARPPAAASHGLVNPEVVPRKAPGANRKPAVSQTRTSVPTAEPRWQRIVSLVIVICLIAVEVWIWHNRK